MIKRKSRLLVIVLACLILSSCSKSQNEQIELLEPVMGTDQMSIVTRGNIQNLQIFDAQIIPDVEELSFDVNGYLEQVSVAYGKFVKKGDILAVIAGENHEKIEEMTQKIEFLEEQSKAKIDVLNAELDLLKYSGQESELQELLIKHEKELALLEIEQNTRKLEELKEGDIGIVELKAPYDSVVVGVSKSTSSRYLSANTPIIALVGKGQPTITCEYIKEKTIEDANYYYAIIHGEEYELEYIPYEKEELNSLVAQGADMVSRFNIKDYNEDKLKTGDYASVVIVNDLKEDVLLIPQSAVYQDAEGKFVYELIDGERVRKNVTLGDKDKQNIEVIDGLGEGAYVYVKN